MRRVFSGLYAQVLLAIVVGAAVGHFAPETGTALKPLGDAFVKLVKMVVTPIVFCTVVVGIASMGDLKKVGRVGAKALIYFEVVTTMALIIGLVTVNLVRPGAGIHADPAALDSQAVAAYAKAASEPHGVMDFVLDVIPANIVGAFADGNILQVLFFAVLFGFALALTGAAGRPLVATIEQVSQAMFKVVGIIMRVAPLGALGAMAFTIGAYGFQTLGSLALLMATFYLTCFLFVFGVLGAIAFAHGFSIWAFLRYIRQELLLVLGTSSSESALPHLMLKLERLGCSRGVVGLVVPTGYSFNLDGTSIYLTMAAVFIAQACDISLTLQQELTILAVLLLTSKGAAGVVGSGFVTLAATLATVGQIPVAGVALILGIDRFMSEARAITNLIGNGVATVVISRWENELDVPRMEAVLAGREVAPIDGVVEAAALPSPAAALRDVSAADTPAQGHNAAELVEELELR